MKTFHASLQAHYAQAVTALAEGWRVTRQVDSAVFGWSTASFDVTIDTVLYRSSEGLTPTATHTTNDLSVDSLDVSIFMTVSTELEIAAGLWDESEVVHFEYMYDAPPATLTDTKANIKRAGTLGRIQRRNLMLTAEIRGLADAFQTRIGRQYSPVCPWRHGTWAGSTYVTSVECQADLGGLGFIIDGSITSVGADATAMFSDSASAQADGYFEANGLITMTNGANNGITREVLAWQGKQFTLLRPFPYPVVVTNTYRALRGDDKTKATCKGIYLNYLNNGGFFDVPGADAAYATPAGI